MRNNGCLIVALITTFFIFLLTFGVASETQSDGGILRGDFGFSLAATAAPRSVIRPTITPSPTPASLCRLRVSVLNPVNLRAEPSRGAAIVEILSANTPMEAVEVVVVGGLRWYRVQLVLNGEAIEGYIRQDVVAELTPCPR